MIYSSKRQSHWKTISTKIITLLLLINFGVSCSFVYSKRMPADDVYQAEDNILKLFSFKKGKHLTQQNPVDLFDSIKKSTVANIVIEYIEDSTLQKDTTFFLEFKIENNQNKMVIHHTKEATQDLIATAELKNFLTEIGMPPHLASNLSIFELFYNVTKQDPASTLVLVKLRKESFNLPYPYRFESDIAAEAQEIMSSRKVEWDQAIKEFLIPAKKQIKEKKKLDLERRAVIDVLDKASDDQQLKGLVARNDRKGVAELIKKYLPWEEMAPFEKRYWDTYLDVIANPVSIDKRVLIFRGINDDMIYSAIEEGVELKKDEALKEGKFFLMSSLLTKNQGTWNRRLRSLTSMNEKFIGTVGKTSEYSKSSRIITMFVNHSKDPKGSPFLSFSPLYSIARTFGYTRMVSLALDPRLLSFNFISKYGNEVEFLMPLITFPDDMASVFDSSEDLINSENSMKEKFKAKLLAAYGEKKGSEIYEKIINNSTKFFDPVITPTALSHVPSVPSTSGIKFEQLTIKNDKKPTPVGEYKSGDSCNNLLKLFW